MKKKSASLKKMQRRGLKMSIKTDEFSGERIVFNPCIVSCKLRIIYGIFKVREADSLFR